MPDQTILESLQSIEATACETYTDLQAAANAFQTIKTDCDIILQQPKVPADVKAVVEAIKVIACATYTTLAAAILAMTAVKTSAAIAIDLLGA